MGLCTSFRLTRLVARVHTVPVAMFGPADMLTTQPRALSARLPRAGTSLRQTKLEALAHDVPAALSRSGKMMLLLTALRALPPRAG